MKAIIPVAGVGTALRPHTHTQPKALVPVAGKPLISHIVDFLMSGGVTDFIFVIGYMGNKIEKYVKNHYQDKALHLRFVVQDPRRGSAHAVWCTREKLKNDEPLLIMLGDTIINMDLGLMLRQADNVLGIKKVGNPGEFGIAEVDQNGYVTDLVEKPKIPRSNLGMTGLYKISHSHQLLASIEEMLQENPSDKQDYNLTDACKRMIQKGERFSVVEVDNWYDCGKKDTLLEANARLLRLPGMKTSHTAEYPNTIIIPPVKIGRNCEIKNSIIGPNVVIADHTSIGNCIISNSILGSYSQIESLILDQSISGNDTSLKGGSQSLNIGENTEIHFI